MGRDGIGGEVRSGKTQEERERERERKERTVCQTFENVPFTLKG